MSAVNIPVGMMDDAYFVGRNTILEWLNDLLKLNLTKIEETASGAVACQVMDFLFPGKVPMSRVNWGAKTDYEFVGNYKVLQGVFDSVKVDKRVEVDKLTRAKHQDNLEFMQWLKKFYEVNCSGDPEAYDAIERRNKGKGVNMFKPAQGRSSSLQKPAARTQRAAAPAEKKPAPPTTAAPRTSRPAATSTSKPTTSGTSRPRQASEDAPKPPQGGASSAELANVKEALNEKTAELESALSTNAELKNQVDGLERERDFYFGKLREVEILLQQYGGADKDLVRHVLKILYATEDDADGEQALAAAEQAMEAMNTADETGDPSEAPAYDEDY